MYELTQDPMDTAVLMALKATTSWPSPMLTHSISLRLRRDKVSMESVGSAPNTYIHTSLRKYSG